MIKNKNTQQTRRSFLILMKTSTTKFTASFVPNGERLNGFPLKSRKKLGIFILTGSIQDSWWKGRKAGRKGGREGGRKNKFNQRKHKLKNKMLLKEIKHLNKWRDFLCSWISRLKIVDDNTSPNWCTDSR
jgi:hypothetical protein